MKVGKPKRDNSRASADYTKLWNSLNWTIIENVVNKLQLRIAKAIVRGRINLVKKLQYLLTKSFYARLIAVKRATSNKGKKTPGVDGEVWLTSSCKYKGALKLSNKGYKALPLKRTFINKANGKKRPLGIPTIYDRAMQALYLLSLDPVAETVLDKTSFGFRRFRSCKDASSYLFLLLCQKTSSKWVLEGDIKGCFDNISHKWLQENVVMENKILHQFLKSGYIYSNKLYPTVSGSPQGGIISPTYANLTLNGLGDMLRNKYWKSKTGSVHRRHNKNKVNITVYADDFIVTANSKELLVEIKMMIEVFLKERGLQLSVEKTVITHIKEGFDFLGWNFRKYKDKLIIKPSTKSVKKIIVKLRETIKTNLMQKQEILITRLNQIIRGWCNYHKHTCAKKTFQVLDKHVFDLLWRWAKRRHPMKSKSWRKDKYFVRIKHRDWIFKSEVNQLKFASDTKIERHVLIRLDANPYLKEYDEYYLKKKAC